MSGPGRPPLKKIGRKKIAPKKDRPGFPVYCGDCLHTWIAFYFAMRADLIIHFKDIACPMCAGMKVFCGTGPTLPVPLSGSPLMHASARRKPKRRK
jgi:hypothetical protein